MKPVKQPTALASAREKFSLGAGELMAIILAQELKADSVLIDDKNARRVALEKGLPVLGCVGVLEDAYKLKLLSDLGKVYRQLLASNAYISRRILEKSLKAFNLPPL